MTDCQPELGTKHAKPKYAFLDLEIAREFDAGLDKEDAWARARAGAYGISVACVYESWTKRYRFYDELTLEGCLEPILEADCLVTYNGLGFDLPCLSGVLGYRVVPFQHFDILNEIWVALGERRYEKGWGLGPVSQRTIGLGKLGDGVSAISLYQEGRFAELYTYCLNDVLLTRKLFEHIQLHGQIIGPDGEPLKLGIPGLQWTTPSLN